MDWKEVAAIVGSISGWIVCGLWVKTYTDKINKILFMDRGGLNVITVEEFERHKASCRTEQVLPILAAIDEIKKMLEKGHESTEKRRAVNDRRMQRIASVNGNVAVAIGLIAEQNLEKNTPTLQAAIKRIEEDARELANIQ